MTDTFLLLPEVLTSLAYVLLVALGIWVVAHGLSIAQWMRRRPHLRWPGQAQQIADALSAGATRLEQLTRTLRAERTEQGAARAATVEAAGECLHAGPGSRLVVWLRTRHEIRDSLIVDGIERAMQAENKYTSPPGISKASTDTMRGSWNGWQARLSVAAMAGPPAGAAPTMSGTMGFLRDYTATVQDGVGVPPMAGLNDALVTTYFGCAICVAGVILLAVVHGMFRTAADSLSESITIVVEAYEDYQQAEYRMRAALSAATVRVGNTAMLGKHL